jgi:bacteriocin biosynthesis cyclodehydratase domain-containing protein
MVLRLSPDVPVVWRNPFDVQLGVDEVRLVLTDVSPGHERLLAALTAGVSEAGYSMIAKSAGVDAADAEALLRALEGDLVLARAAPAPRVEVLGTGPVASGLAALVTDPAASGPPAFAILVADWVVSPADHGTWLRRDIPHLPVVLGDGGATIGPFVEPGFGPCLHCVHRTREDADPAWPAIATQLWGRPAPTLDPVTLGEVTSFAARRIRERVAQGSAPVAVELASSWRLAAADGSVSERSWSRHPGCLCAAPQESDWAREADLGAPPWPRRERVAAAPG